MFDPGRFAVWLALCLALNWLLGWLAAQIGLRFAPLILFPLLEGLALGGLMVVLLRSCNQGNRPATLLGLVPAVLVLVVGQHYASYRTAQTEIEAMQQAVADKANAAGNKPGLAAAAIALAPESPANLLEFMEMEAAKGRPLLKNVSAHGGWAWASWGFDALLVIVAAAFVVLSALKQPYCNQCHSWYRVIRAAIVPENCGHAISSACGLADEPPFRASRYLLLSCQGGCGPDALDLIRESIGTGPTANRVRIWLSIAQRQAVTALLDQPTVRGGTES